MSVRVLDVKAQIPAWVLVDFGWNVDSFGRQVVAQCTSVTGLETDTDESVFIAFQARRDIDVLMIVDFERRARSAAVSRPGLKCLCQPNNTPIKSARRFEAVCFDRNVCDTHDRWPRCRRFRPRVIQAC